MKTKILLIIALAISLCASIGKNSKNQQNNVCEGNFPTEIFQAILQQLDLKCDNCYLEFVSLQPLHGEPDVSVWIVPQVTYMEKEGNDNYSFSLACHILLADNKGKILSGYGEPLNFYSDAYELKSLSVYTTFYRLSDKVSAFGISTAYAAGSSVSRANNTSTSLFIRQGNSLKKIFDYEPNNYNAAISESGDDGYVSISEKVTLSDKTTNGLYDIILRRDSTFTVFAQDSSEVKATTETDFRFFRYNGKQYKEGATDNSVICEKTYIEVGDYEECFYFGKTLVQVYEILKEKESHLKKYLPQELPNEDAEYNFEENDETTHVSYKRTNNRILIDMQSVGGSTTICITEKRNLRNLPLQLPIEKNIKTKQIRFVAFGISMALILWLGI